MGKMYTKNKSKDFQINVISRYKMVVISFPHTAVIKQVEVTGERKCTPKVDDKFYHFAPFPTSTMTARQNQCSYLKR